jgi:hypothetical protein
MKSEDEQKQKALTKFAAIVVGLEGADDEIRAAALRSAILHGVTNTECIRECLRLRVSGFRVAAGRTRESFPMQNDFCREVGKAARKTASEFHLFRRKEDAAVSREIAA